MQQTANLAYLRYDPNANSVLHPLFHGEPAWGILFPRCRCRLLVHAEHPATEGHRNLL